MSIGPAPAIRRLLEGAGLTLEQVDRFEINEAFAAQLIAVERELGLDRKTLNVNGGAIAIGHPLAATGIRLAVTLSRELRRSKLRYGIASAGIGGGRELRRCSKIRIDYAQVRRVKLSRSARPSSPRNSRMTWRKRGTSEFVAEGHRFIQIPKMSGNHNMKICFIF